MTALAEYKKTAEFEAWKDAHTFGGYVWPETTARRPSTAESMNAIRIEHARTRFEEVMWRLELGDHQLLIAQELGFKPAIFARWCRRNGFPETAALFERGEWSDRRADAARSAGKDVA